MPLKKLTKLKTESIWAADIVECPDTSGIAIGDLVQVTDGKTIEHEQVVVLKTNKWVVLVPSFSAFLKPR